MTNSTKETRDLSEIRGFIARLPEEKRKKVSECYEKIKGAVSEYGEEGKVALVLLGTELATEL